MNEYPHGASCWFELVTSDGRSAKEFYTKIFGWTFNDAPLPGGGVYTMFLNAGRTVGAGHEMDSARRQSGIPPHWGVYFRVHDCDATTTQAASVGGKILMQPFDVMDAGRMAMISDPEGAVFGLWEPKTNRGAGVIHERNAVAWVELACRDTGKAGTFYQALFGWTLTDQPMPVGGIYRRASIDGKDWGGILPMNEQWGDIPSSWSVYFQVANADESAAAIKALGGSWIVPPFDAPPAGRLGLMADPQGAAFYIIQPLNPA